MSSANAALTDESSAAVQFRYSEGVAQLQCIQLRISRSHAEI